MYYKQYIYMRHFAKTCLLGFCQDSGEEAGNSEQWLPYSPIFGRLLPNCQPTVGQLLADIKFWELFFTITEEAQPETLNKGELPQGWDRDMALALAYVCM